MNESSEKNIVLFISTLGSFLTPFMGSAVNIALPSIGKELAMNAVLLNWVATTYLLSAGIFLVPFGALGDLYGRKRIFLYGIIFFTISSVLCSLSPNAALLLIFRIFQGISGSMIMSTGIAMLTSVFPAEERGKALGINTSAVYLGLSLGPFLGGILTQHLGWRSVFYINAPIGLFAIAIILWKLEEEWKENKEGKIDFVGFVLYALSLTCLIYGVSILPQIHSLLFIFISLVSIIAFIYWETKFKNPLLNIKLFRNNVVFTFSNLSALINYSATFGIAFILSLYLQYIKGITPQNAGMILLFQPLTMTLLSPFAGRISDKIEPRIVASSGMALTTLALFLFIFLNKITSFSYIIANLILLGIGFALFSSPNTNAVMSSVEKRFYGVASGTLGTMRLIGQMMSMGVIMLIFAIQIGKVQITPEHYPSFLNSMKTLFTIFTILCFLGIYTSLARGKLR
ncbi:MAG TPA: MFS transporter [Candidatus Hydrogenedens sp.]|nr:MFS transporter [Candidatus Hydrogenedens sp.]